MSTPGIPPTPGNSGLIRVYYLYRTNISKVFEALFKSFLTSSKDLSLIPSVPDENDLIKRLAETMNKAFPVPKSMISLRFGGTERLLLNAIQRVFGYYLPMEKFPVSSTVNAAFHKTTDYIFRNLALGIVGRTSLLLDFKNPGGLLEYITVLQSSLLTNETNTVNEHATRFNLVYARYKDHLRDNLLMDKLGIVGAGIDQRLISMGRKLGVPVVRNPLVFFDLADSMSAFIEKIETTSWNITEVSKLYEAPYIDTFKVLFSAYREVWGIDYMGYAMGAIRQAMSTSTPPVQSNRV